MTIPGWAGRCGRSLLSCLLLLFAGHAAAAPITLVDNRAAGFVGMALQGPLDTPVTVYSWIEYEQFFGGSTAALANPYLYASVFAYFDNGGYELTVVRVANTSDAAIIGVDGGVPGARTGMQALRDASVTAIAIPGVTTQPVQAALLALCESMGDRLAILDPVAPTSVSAVTAQRAALSTGDGFGALYFPWLQYALPGAPSPMPPSAFAAGLLARTAASVSPAGAALGASGVSTPVNSTQSSDLTLLGINPIRFFVAQGVQFFGARTLASNPEWKYLLVRREGFELSASLRAGTAWCLTEPNDETLWSQLTTDMNDFLHMLWLGGWFQGATPSAAYFAKCDATTMTAQDLADGRTVMLVGFAPITAGEFIVLRIVQQRAPTASAGPLLPALSLSAPHPNPFGARTSIAFELPSAAAVTIQVHDIGGRLVRSLAAGEEFPAGRHERVWDGCDSAGGAAAAGVYLVRLQSGDRVLTGHVTLVR